MLYFHKHCSGKETACVSLSCSLGSSLKNDLGRIPEALGLLPDMRWEEGLCVCRLGD